MKRFVVLVVLCIGGFLAGCGLVDTYEQRERRYKNIVDLQARMMIDDWDYFWLADKVSYVTEWPLRDAD